MNNVDTLWHEECRQLASEEDNVEPEDWTFSNEIPRARRRRRRRRSVTSTWRPPSTSEHESSKMLEFRFKVRGNNHLLLYSLLLHPI